MDFKLQIDQLREEFKMANLNNSRVMEIIDALYAENSKLIQLLNMKIRDIDDEQ
tara:strand:- start:6376 stop:6537 length:162 start_codon:yes stop_codon:yes gene_type:complete